MRKLSAPAVLVCLVLASLVVPAAATASPGAGFDEWHRNNYGAGHERLQCLERPPAWTCAYKGQDAEPTSGWFYGRNVTASWSCPDWFAAEICDVDNLVGVYRGATIYIDTAGDGEASVIRQDYVVTKIDGQEILYLYWRESPFFGEFYCPWFRTFDEALDAPFECTFH